MKKTTLSAIALLIIPSSLIQAQESSFNEYMQPMRNFVSFKANFENGLDKGHSLITNGDAELETADGNSYARMEAPGSWFFTIADMAVPSDGITEFVDVEFDIKTEVGCAAQMVMRVGDRNNASNATDVFRIPDAAATGWVRMRIRGKVTFPRTDRPSIEFNVGSTQPDGVGGEHDDRARYWIDNLQVSFPKRLVGVYRTTGTTDKNLGAITFSNNGTTLGSYTDWFQNLGNVQLLDVYGRTNLGFDTDAKSTSTLLLKRENGNHDELSMERLSDTFDSISNKTWIGTSGIMTGTDRYYGVHIDADKWGQQYLFRQNENNGVYRHTVRCLSSSFYYGAERAVDLGGKELVAVADINGDGKDDFITRSESKFKARLFTGITGSDPNKDIVLSAPIDYNPHGHLKVLAVAPINDDATDDLLVQDMVSGDIFAAYCSKDAMSLNWLFRLNTPGTDTENEKFLSFADADNDNRPEVYTIRQSVSTGQWEVDIRKINATMTSATVSAYTRLASFDQSFYKPCAVGDVNGDGGADVVMVSDDASNNQLATFLVNPANRTLLGSPNWIANARGSHLRPIYK